MKKFTLILALLFFGFSGAFGKDTKYLGNLDCGQEGQKRCNPLTKEFWNSGNGGCDRGLTIKDKKCVNKRRRTLIGEENEWIGETLKFQRELQKDLPLYNLTMVAAHNAFNARNDGYVFPNQRYSMTDLLNIGVRLIMSDIHWFHKRLRMCHAICSHFDRPWHAYVEELALWLRDPKNKGEVVILELEVYWDSKYDDAFLEPLRRYVWDLLWRPSDVQKNPKFTLEDIRKAGKSLIIYPRKRFGQDVSHGTAPLLPGWPRDFVKNWDGKSCEFKDPDGKFHYKIEPRVKGQKKWTGFSESAARFLGVPIGLRSSGQITLDNIEEGRRCNLTMMTLDWVSPEKMKKTIWSWKLGEPKKWDDEERCVQIQRDGSWITKPCNEKAYYACKSEVNSGHWLMTYEQGEWKDGDHYCDDEYQGDFRYDHPTNGFENSRIHLNNHNFPAWIKFSNKGKVKNQNPPSNPNP